MNNKSIQALAYWATVRSGKVRRDILAHCRRRYWDGTSYVKCYLEKDYYQDRYCRNCQAKIDNGNVLKKPREMQRYYPSKYNPHYVIDWYK